MVKNITNTFNKMLSRPSKGVMKLLFTSTIVGTAVITPVAYFGIKDAQKGKADRVPFELLTPLSRDWYTDGDISNIKNGLFGAYYSDYFRGTINQINAHESIVKPEHKDVAFARLNYSQLDSIKGTYENPIMDLRFTYDSKSGDITQYSDFLFNTPLNSYHSGGWPAATKLLAGNTNPTLEQVVNAKWADDAPSSDWMKSFGLRVNNYLYTQIEKFYENPASLGYDIINPHHYSIFTYTIDNDLDHPKDFRVQVWPSTLQSVHSDGKTINSQLNLIKNLRQMDFPGSVINSGWGIFNSSFSKIVNDNSREDTFCYVGDDISEKSTGDSKILIEHMCAPLSGQEMTLTKTNGSSKNVLTASLTDTVFGKISGMLDTPSEITELTKEGGDLEWLNPTTIIVETDTIRFKIKDSFKHKYFTLLSNEKEKDKNGQSKTEWKLVHNLGVGHDNKIDGWWTIFDLLQDTSHAAMASKNYVGTWKGGPHDTEKYCYEITSFNPNKIARDKWTDTNITDSSINPAAVACDHTYYTTTDGSTKFPVTEGITGLVYRKNQIPSYRFYDNNPDATDQATALKGVLNQLPKIGNLILNDSVFKAVSALANDLLGESFLTLLTSIASIPSSKWETFINNYSNQFLTDTTINVASLIPEFSPAGTNTPTQTAESMDKFYSQRSGDTLSGYASKSSMMTFLLWFNSEERLEKLANGFLEYDGFHIQPDVSTLSEYRPLDGGHNMSSVNAGLIAWVIKYGLAAAVENLRNPKESNADFADNTYKLATSTTSNEGLTKELVNKYFDMWQIEPHLINVFQSYIPTTTK